MVAAKWHNFLPLMFFQLYNLFLGFGWLKSIRWTKIEVGKNTY